MKKGGAFFFPIFGILLALNIYAFINSIYFGNDLLKIEKNIERLKVENVSLKNSITQIDTLEYTASAAAALDLNHPLSFWYLEPVKYARSY
jgi:ATP-dependent RNA circularization protein (DNA/RNA ligase family)